MNAGPENDVLVQKITSLQRCVARARQTRERAGDEFAANFDLQDAAVLNIIRACETAIDLANMMIRRERLGIPAESREAFEILAREQRITRDLAGKLKSMVGFRNIAVHQYRDLQPEIVAAVIDQRLGDLLAFAEQIRQALAVR